MFLNILRISASNILDMFLQMIASTWCTFIVFDSYKPATGSIDTFD